MYAGVCFNMKKPYRIDSIVREVLDKSINSPLHITDGLLKALSLISTTSPTRPSERVTLVCMYDESEYQKYSPPFPKD